MNFKRGGQMRKSEQKARHIFNENSLTAHILAVIGTGEENAVTSRQIQRAFGVNQRELRKIVEKCRKSGVFILASDQGYFYPASKDELQRFIRRESNRVKNQCIAIAPLKRYLKQLDSG